MPIRKLIKRLLYKIKEYFENTNYISKNAKIGKNVFIQGSIVEGKVEIRNACRIYKSIIKGNDVFIGEYTSIWGPDIIINQHKYPIIIGKYCSIARNVDIREYNHNKDKLTTYNIGKNRFRLKYENERVSKGSIEIGNDVWIASGVRILSGSKIGNGCIVAANAVVNRSYPPYSIVGGVPGKVIGYRFDENIRRKLEELEWWNWPDEKIEINKFLFEKELSLDMLNNIKD